MTDIQIKIGILIVDQNRLLLIKERLNPKAPYRWNIIKGTYDNVQKESIFKAANRECLEEAGVKVKLVGLINCIILTRKKKELRIQYNFLAKIVSRKPKIAIKEEQFKRNEDIKEIRWFAKKEASKLGRKSFISQRAFLAVKDWIINKKYPIEILHQIRKD